MSDWLCKLSENDLKAELDPSIRQILEGVDKAGGNINHIGAALAYPLPHLGPEENRLLATNFWSRVKQEMYILVCTDDSKYGNLRKELSKRATVASSVIVATIAAAVSRILGFRAALLTPFVVLCLIALVRVGKEAWCRSICQGDKAEGC
jgi:hypothetical protein